MTEAIPVYLKRWLPQFSECREAKSIWNPEKGFG